MAPESLEVIGWLYLSA